jgi:hypothetical protein
MGYTGDEPQKVIIFDWDDTICPSSFFDRQQMEKMDELPESVSSSLSDQIPFVLCFNTLNSSISRKENQLFVSALHDLTHCADCFLAVRIIKSLQKFQNVPRNAFAKHRNTVR